MGLEKYVENMKKLVKNMKKYVENVKEYAEKSFNYIIFITCSHSLHQPPPSHPLRYLKQKLQEIPVTDPAIE